MKNIAAQQRRWFNAKGQLYWCKSRIYKVWKPAKYPPTLWKISEISYFSPLLSSLRHEAHSHLAKNENIRQRGWKRDTSHNIPLVLFLLKTKRLECPYGQKEKLQLMKGSLVRLLLRRTRQYRIDRLLLHFHATYAMMPHAPRRRSFASIETRLGNPKPTCFMMKQVIGCRHVSLHRIYPLIDFEA
jgi:hypothetical protein